MALRQVVEYLSDGYVVELFNGHKRVIYRLSTVEPKGVISFNVSWAGKDLLAEDEWPLYIHNSFKDTLVQLDERPDDLPVTM